MPRHSPALGRERFTVSDGIVEDGAVVGIAAMTTPARPSRARVVIGADGCNSYRQGRRPEHYNEKPMLQ
jgi:flavin-dependent dehydrogenase